MGQPVIPALIKGSVMKRCTNSFSARLAAILALSASLLIKGIQAAFILLLAYSAGEASIESLATAVTHVFGGGANETVAGGSVVHTLGSFEADRGLRLFAFVYLCLWLVVGGFALLGLLLDRFLVLSLVNLVVFLLGLCVESLLTVTLVTEAGLWSTFFSYFPLFVDSLANVSLIALCCRVTKNGMSFDPQEYQEEVEQREIRERKHNISLSSTFKRFDVVDG